VIKTCCCIASQCIESHRVTSHCVVFRSTFAHYIALYRLPCIIMNNITGLNHTPSHISHCIALYHIALPFKLHRIASHRNALNRIASHRIASHCIESHRIASHCIALNRIAMYCIASRCIALHRIASLASHRIVAHRIASQCIVLHCIESH
jgi:hypothetical protein